MLPCLALPCQSINKFRVCEYQGAAQADFVEVCIE